ncbi:hypothetical protein [Rhodopirellula sallentina]|uniref:hypothetical protein n=1 Tax=Rhodopirellula sallentina TaxID=1263869 RepID=UPI001181AB3D|nr:hypothetical protein [Rhodopirellula sallentina]
MRFKMKTTFSLNQLLLTVIASAIAFAFWTLAGHTLLCGVVVFSVLACLIGCIRATARLRNIGLIGIAMSLAVILSLGPAIAAYTIYDPGYRESPVVRRVFVAVYKPVGRVYSIPIEPLPSIGYAYLRWWMPSGLRGSVKNYGYGPCIRSDGGRILG